MKKESWFYRFLKRIGLIKTYKINKEDRWIQCSEGLPECQKQVLVTLMHTYDEHDGYAEYSIARRIAFEDGEWHWCDNHYGYLEWDRYSSGSWGSAFYKVVAWMPIPTYKEQNNG